MRELQLRGGGGLGLKAAGADGLDEGGVVALRLVGVGSCKFREGYVKFFASSEIAADFGCIASASVSARQSPAADFDVLEPIAPGHILQVDFHFHVAELAEIIAAAFCVVSPSEENVARGLEHALAGDDSLAVIDVAAFAGVGLKDRRKRLFELEEHGVVLSGHEQGDGAARSDAADSHHFSRNIDDVITIENYAALGRKSFAIGAEHLGYVFLHDVAFARVVNQRRMIDDSSAAIYYVSDFRKNVLGGLKARLVFDFLPTFFCGCGLGFFDEDLGVHARIPYFQVAHACVFAHLLTIGERHSKHGIFAASSAETHFTRGQDYAGGQALDIPFPGSLKRFVEIVDVEKKLAFGASKAAEIRRVTITTGLDADSCRGSFRKIPGHHCRRTSEVRKRRLAHTAVADRQKLGEATAVGLLQHFDGIGPADGRSPLGVGSAGDFFSKSFTRFHARFDTWPNHVRFFGSNTVNSSALGTHRLGLIERKRCEMIRCGAVHMVARRVRASHEEISCTRPELACGAGFCRVRVSKAGATPALHRLLATLHLECGGSAPLRTCMRTAVGLKTAYSSLTVTGGRDETNWCNEASNLLE